MRIDENGYLCETVYQETKLNNGNRLIHISKAYFEGSEPVERKYKVNSKGLFEEVIDNN